MRFDNKIVVVTGAGSGIGEATARRFSADGATVLLVARSEEKLSKVAASLPSDRTEWISADLSTEEGARALAAKAQAMGGADVLVNNAGIAVGGTIEEVSVEDWNKQIQTNLTGYFLVTKFFWDQLKAKKGNVVMTSSVSGLGGDWEMFAYNASKGGITNMVRALALDGAKLGIRVNAVNPALTKSDMTKDMLDDAALMAKFRERQPLEAPADPSGVADAIAFLASPDARLITGVNLPVDGGVMASNGQPPQ
ncbi:SDR family NAD(P)-dependent oxidoreductase [Falsirhodobacter sp. 20TX0035]|uniref:SDR family NAD(P)-dependent oxidoreductase n=1 Tax=Falsirhodobacter sp. 20TX0035 TaxID=3022019 RepID=UPI00232B87E4|nr:SDR family oxidoreductase [Falsirhodobacter sp. 20TX0035]MDB6453493.1 SDR family NAD(P)-dependent oxidoreductase [Falsirhodobacter sp. 20TX0035]